MNNERYRDIRAALGWSMLDMARYSGRNERDVRGWAGKRTIPPDVGAWLEAIIAISGNPPSILAAQPDWRAGLEYVIANPPPNPRKEQP